MTTVAEEMEQLGITFRYFVSYLDLMKEHSCLPTPSQLDSTYARQTDPILDYLRQQKILEDGDKINPDNLKLLDERLGLEMVLAELNSKRDEYPSIRDSGGGLAPCRRPSSRMDSGGGLMPCRD